MINRRVVKPFVDKTVLTVLDGGIFGVDITREKSFTIWCMRICYVRMQ